MTTLKELATMDAAGLVVVPREPTEAMSEAGHEAVCDDRDQDGVWRAMLAASPYVKKEVDARTCVRVPNGIGSAPSAVAGMGEWQTNSSRKGPPSGPSGSTGWIAASALTSMVAPLWRLTRTDRTELRRLAEAAASGPWWTSDKLKCHPDLELSDDTAYIAAASPDVVRGLLDEVDGLSLAAKVAEDHAHRWAEERDQLRAVLGKIAEFDPAVTHDWAVHVREMARNALKAR